MYMRRTASRPNAAPAYFLGRPTARYLGRFRAMRPRPRPAPRP